jgi:hypothetical protein
MKPKQLSWTLGVLMLCAGIAHAQLPHRDRMVFDLGWKFHLGDVSGAKDPLFDDASWRSVNLPHDWSIEANFNKQYASCTGYLPGGFGWYRKSFDIPRGHEGKTITLQFDGVYCNSEVWVNGTYLGNHPYGYTSFSYNITSCLEVGKKNVVAVRVDHMKYADTRWYSGSGIYRHVWITATEKVHVAQWGTHVVTPDANPSVATVTVKTTVANDNKVTTTVRLLSSIVNRDGKEVAMAGTEVRLSDSLTPVNQAFTIKKPVLWDTENPYLYAVRTKIVSGTDVMDEYETPFGIRTVRFDPDKGFFLNGVSTKLKGVCLHHDGGCVGAAVPEKIWRTRLEKLKAMGCNAIRTSHNPAAPEFLDLCDHLGFLVMGEAFDEWEYPKRKWIDGWNQTQAGYDGYPDIFEQWGEKDLRDMVDRDKNHPSIIIWSIGNEVDYSNDPYADPTLAEYSPDRPDASRMVDIARRFSTIVKSIDPSRPVTMAIANIATSNKVGLPGVLDIAGYNYTEGSYQNDHTQYPARILYGSENSHNYSAWLAVKNNDFISAQFLWTGVDYMGEAGKFPLHASTSGLLDLTSFEKPMYYWRQAMWSGKPMLYLAARRMKASDNTSIDPMSDVRGFSHSPDHNEQWNYHDGDSVLVMAFTNCHEAELFINGKSFGKKQSDSVHSCLWWYVPYVPGEVRAAAKGPDNTTLTAVLKTVFEPVTILLKPDATTLKADNHDIAIVEVQLLDKKNSRAVLADNLITFDVSGEGKIIGVDNGDASSLDNYKLSQRKAYAGRCIVIVQTTGKSGTIRLTAKSQGLPDASAELLSE